MVKRITGHLFRYLWLAIATLVIVYALLVVAGREFLPVINRFQPEINAYLSEKTGVDFEIQGLKGLWEGASPLLGLGNVVIAGKDGHGAAVTIDNLSAKLNIYQSITNRSPVWRGLTAGQIRVSLIEDEQGHWTVGGHPLGLGNGGAQLDYVFRMLFYSRLLRIDQLQVDLQFYSGASAQLFAREFQIENMADFHRATGSLALSASGDKIATLILEGEGDPGDLDNFIGKGYLHLNRLDVEGSLHTLLAGWFPDQAEKIGESAMELDLALWFDWQQNALINGRGYLKAAEVPLSWLQDSPTLTELNGEITGWFKPGEDWGFGVQNLTANWNGAAIEPFALQFRQRVGRYSGELDVAANYLDLAPLNNLLLSSGFFDNKAGEVLSALQPAGKVRQLSFDMDFSGDAPEFLVKANLDDISVGSWSGAPAARGVSGYIEANLERGFVVLDSPKGFAMHYPQAFADFMPYGATQGKVAWHWLPEQHKVMVTSNLIDIRGEEGQGKAFLHLNLPTEKGGNPEMYLMVGMKNSHTRFVDRYLPQVLNEGLRSWLDRAVGDGDIAEAGFIWRGSLVKANDEGRSVQVYARLNNGTVDYQEGWPTLTDTSAILVVDNREMDVWLERGVLAGETVEGIGANLRQSSSGPLLRVVGNLDTEASKGLTILAESPLKPQLAALLALDISGGVAVGLDLRIPLSEDKTQENYQVEVKPQGAALVIPGTDFAIEDIRGEVHYDHRNGLKSDNLMGSLWGQPLKGVIATDDSHIRFTTDGVVDAVGLNTLLGPYSDYAKGKAAVAAELLVPRQGGGGPGKLALTSNLKGLALTLPEPFTKAAKSTLNTRLNLEIAEGSLMIHGAAEDKLALVARIEEGVLSRGALALLSDTAELPAFDGLSISGNLDAVDWGQWQPVIAAPGGSEHQQTLPDKIRLDLTMTDLIVGGFPLGSTVLRGQSDGNRGWQLNIDSMQAGGAIWLASGEAPPVVNLEYLKIPKPDPATEAAIADLGEKSRAEEKGGLFDDVSPSSIPELDVQVKSLFYGDEALGNLSFKSRHIGNGVVFNEIEGALRGINIKPQVLADDRASLDPAELRWTLADGIHTSFFSGTLEIADIETVIARWQIPPPFASKEATFFVNLGWEDKPWEVNTLALDGYLGIDFRDGQFYEASGGAADALFKLVGLINFDTWLRRLRFDFSDFFSDGMSFDKVQGGLLFRKGLVDFDDPVVASMPGGKIRLLGSADLIYEQLNAHLVATMPVGTNLPWVAGLLGGLPAAVGVFVTSKLFEKQVDQLSSIGYRVTGPFDDPEIEVERIFTDPTKLSTEEMSADETVEEIRP